MNYTGKLRIATGLAFLHAFTETVDNAAYTKSRESLPTSRLDLPLTVIFGMAAIRILHGDADRTTSHKASMTYMDQVTSADKSIKLYEDHQHVMVKVCALRMPYLLWLICLFGRSLEASARKPISRGIKR